MCSSDLMISLILDHARLSEGQVQLLKEPTNITAMVKSVCEELGENGNPVQKGLPEEDCYFPTNAEALRVVIRNILSNAMKYSNHQLKPVEVSHQITSDEQGTNQLTITIRDFGYGIAEEEVPKIFEPFYRIDKSRQKATGGVGLGLSLAKRLVDALDGTIELMSRLDEGTKVTLKF